MSAWLLTLPILIPLVTAATSLVLWRSVRAQRAAALIGAIALLVAALALTARVDAEGIQVMQAGAWEAPFGISLVADLFSAIMVTVAAAMGLAIVYYSLWSMDRERESFCYYPLLQVLLMGVCGAFLTGDLFNLYVWFEVMLMASFVLLSLGGERPQLEGAIKYVTLNLVSSAVFLSAVGILYGIVGTLNMADLAVKLNGDTEPVMATTLAMMFLVAFGIKAAIFPLFFWLPASYHTPPIAVTAIFAGLLTKVGVYALMRVFTLLFTQDVGFTHTVILVLAGFTMVTGVLGAAAQNEFRRILTFHIVSQIGYLIMGLALFTPLALAGSVYYMVHVIIAKTNLFLIGGVVYASEGTYELKKLGGLYKRRPYLSLAFMISAMALAGIPPLSGFFAKYSLAAAGLDRGSYGIVAAALGVSVLTLFSMTKIWAAAFWAPGPTEPAAIDAGGERRIRAMMVPVAALAGASVAMGVGAEYFIGLSMRASAQLLDPNQYIGAVLGRTAL